MLWLDFTVQSTDFVPIFFLLNFYRKIVQRNKRRTDNGEHRNGNRNCDFDKSCVVLHCTGEMPETSRILRNCIMESTSVHFPTIGDRILDQTIEFDFLLMQQPNPMNIQCVHMNKTYRKNWKWKFLFWFDLLQTKEETTRTMCCIIYEQKLFLLGSTLWHEIFSKSLTRNNLFHADEKLTKSNRTMTYWMCRVMTCNRSCIDCVVHANIHIINPIKWFFFYINSFTFNLVLINEIVESIPCHCCWDANRRSHKSHSIN